MANPSPFRSSKRRKFVADGVFYAELNEFFQRELAEEGYSGVEVRVTPTVTDVFANQPIVAVDPHVGGSPLPTIDSQNFEGARAMTEHLLELGHRRIAFLAGRPDLESARRREAGYRAALEAAGVPFDPDLVRIGGFKEETAEAPARELLARSRAEVVR